MLSDQIITVAVMAVNLLHQISVGSKKMLTSESKIRSSVNSRSK